MANYMEKVAQMLGVELEEEFNVDCSNVTYKITKDGMLYWSGEQYGWQSINGWLTELLSGKIKIIKKPILDEAERTYLSNVIKPFRKQVISIGKLDNGNYECIVIKYHNISGYTGTMCFPAFKKDTLYKGMKANKRYSLSELGV